MEAVLVFLGLVMVIAVTLFVGGFVEASGKLESEDRAQYEHFNPPDKPDREAHFKESPTPLQTTKTTATVAKSPEKPPVQCLLSVRELTKREFSQYVYDEFFEGETRSAQASLSRAYKRLVKRGYLKRTRGGKTGWELTLRGEKITLLEWQQERSRYPHIILETS
jgi:hypothetical protein